ncbi:hypothetical protein GIB67_018374 [Kingdonia uniflora]|uniref:Uncharacterized protein n=1 Tax=Kingdonia uniflora TaxID=39325 RepID=A0A7J7MJ98_9MAGN|nr:hypothetical protein GIB67_018374 [Kingdonia uniflora]
MASQLPFNTLYMHPPNDGSQNPVWGVPSTRPRYHRASQSNDSYTKKRKTNSLVIMKLKLYVYAGGSYNGDFRISSSSETLLPEHILQGFEEVHRRRKWVILYLGGVSDKPKFLQWSKEMITNVELYNGLGESNRICSDQVLKDYTWSAYIDCLPRPNNYSMTFQCG